MNIRNTDAALGKINLQELSLSWEIEDFEDQFFNKKN